MNKSLTKICNQFECALVDEIEAFVKSAGDVPPAGPRPAAPAPAAPAARPAAAAPAVPVAPPAAAPAAAAVAPAKPKSWEEFVASPAGTGADKWSTRKQDDWKSQNLGQSTLPADPQDKWRVAATINPPAAAPAPAAAGFDASKVPINQQAPGAVAMQQQIQAKPGVAPAAPNPYDQSAGAQSIRSKGRASVVAPATPPVQAAGTAAP